MAAIEKVVTACYIEDLVEKQGKTHKEVSQILNHRFPGQDGLSERSVRRYCAVNGIRRHDSNLTCLDINSVISTAIAEVGPTYGRKMMTGYLRHSRGLRLGVNKVGNVLKQVNPQHHSERQTATTRHLNPVPYFAEYFGHKLHLDQNEKLVRYGVTEVVSVDGYSSFITAKSVMALKNNIIIYRDVFRKTVLEYGMFDQVRVDHGREFYLVLSVQDHMKGFRNNTSRQPYIQTQSKQNHAVERLWVEINGRTNYPIKRALVEMENDGAIDMDNEVTKFCVSWVTRQVVEVGMGYAVNSWNSHPIPGKGVPLERQFTNDRAFRIDPSIVPTVQTAVQMFSGTLTPEQTFGRDPLAHDVTKADARDNEFRKYFPSFVVLFNEIANANYNPFKKAVLYYLRLTNYLAP